MSYLICLYTVFSPLICAGVIFLSGFVLSKKGSVILSVLSNSIHLIITLSLLKMYTKSGVRWAIDLGPWLSSKELEIKWVVSLDAGSVYLISTVALVSICVQIYSMSYLETEPYIIRFFVYLNMFAFFMYLLISSNNYGIFYIGWEGVGVCSYLLVSFWSNRPETSAAGLKATLLNRVGDISFLLAAGMIYHTYRTFDFSSIHSMVGSGDKLNDVVWFLPVRSCDLVAVLLVLACSAKSAQVALHTWLPDAMEGPTPVSALIHAATMVTAGVILLIKSGPIVQVSSISSYVVLLGSLTAVLSALIAVAQQDIKRVVAYSTCSQLGYMVASCGAKAYTEAMFHLSNHAFFKALLFLGAGCVIHCLKGEQDMRKMGGLWNKLPYAFVAHLIASLSLMGFPGSSGFYSKEAILINVNFYRNKGLLLESVSMYLLIIAAGLTSLYSLLLIFKVYIRQHNTQSNLCSAAHESPLPMSISLISLSIISLVSGHIFKSSVGDRQGELWTNSDILKIQPNSATELEESLCLCVTYGPIFWSVVFLTIYIIVFKFNPSILDWDSNTAKIISNKFFFDRSQASQSDSTLIESREITNDRLDMGIFNLAGAQGAAGTGSQLSKRVVSSSQGVIYTALSVLFVGIAGALVLTLTLQFAGISYTESGILIILIIKTSSSFHALRRLQSGVEVS